MKVVVTGGAGQLGTAVLRRLATEPSVREIVSLDVRPPVVASPKVSHAIGDVRDPGIEPHFRGADAVVHLAFIVTRVLDPAVFQAINVGGSRNVFERAYAAGVRRFVYASSVAAYGVVDRAGIVTEDTERVRDPAFPYAQCKFDVEAFLDEWEPQRPGVAVARMRPSVLMGARIEHNIGKALRMRVLPALPRPVPMVWDEDVADAFALALLKEAKGGFNLSCEAPLDGTGVARAGGMTLLPLPEGVLSAAMAVSDFLSKRGVGVDPAWVRAALADLAPYDTRRAREVLGWKPSCPTGEDVVRRFVDRDPGRMDARLALFFRMADVEAKRAAAVDAADADVHLWLTGPGGGDVTLRVHGGRARVSVGLPRPPSSVVAMETRCFLDLLAGRDDLPSAMAAGRVTVEGDPTGADFVGRMVAGLHRYREQIPGLRGRALSAFSAWLSA